MTDVDLFAGMGGWDHDTPDVVGIEFDAAACATRAAAGLATIRADVCSFDPARLSIGGLIASPPCPTFSQAGKGAGRLVIAELAAAIRDAFAGYPTLARHQRTIARKLRASHLRRRKLTRVQASKLAWAQARESCLMVQPARWVHGAHPEWIAMEQVPDVLPLWKVYAEELRLRGYSTWAGVLNAANYGVPQTRKRAFLIASRVRSVTAPLPTHAKGGSTNLFDELLPWVSMADALGWGMTDRPGMTFTHGSADGGGRTDGLGGSGAREIVRSERDEGRWRVGFPRRDDRGDSEDGYRDRDMRGDDEPAFAVTEKARSWMRTGSNSMKHSRDVEDMVPYERSTDEPAPTVDRKAGTAWSVNTGRDWKEGGDRSDAQAVPVDEPAPAVDATGRWRLQPHASRPNDRTVPRSPEEPAPTVAFGHDAAAWEFRWTEGPATTIAGDSRVWPPGHKVNGDDRARLGTDEANARYGDRRGSGAIRVELADVLVLQSFPADYPVQGSKTKRFEQVGNAVPPLLAQHVLAAAKGIPS